MAAGEDSTLIANTSAVNAMVALLDAKVAAGELIDLAPSLIEIAMTQPMILLFCWVILRQN